MSDNIAELTFNLKSLARVMAMAAIANHGTPEQRTKAVEHLKHLGKFSPDE
jgi:hypothetical protein